MGWINFDFGSRRLFATSISVLFEAGAFFRQCLSDVPSSRLAAGARPACLAVLDRPGLFNGAAQKPSCLSGFVVTLNRFTCAGKEVGEWIFIHRTFISQNGN